MHDTKINLNHNYLLKLRLAIARYGEMDIAKWWNTQGILGEYGRIALGRGFPKTHLFAQANIAFSVVRSRCAEIFDPPECITLWYLGANVEDQFETQWHDWLDEIETWEAFFQKLCEMEGDDLLEILKGLDLLTNEQAEAATKLRRSAEGRAVPLPGVWLPAKETLSLLAAGFCKGEKGNPVIPYARLGKVGA